MGEAQLGSVYLLVGEWTAGLVRARLAHYCTQQKQRVDGKDIGCLSHL